MGTEAPLPGRSAGRAIPEDLPLSLGPVDFRLLAESLPHMVWICGSSGDLQYMNSQGTGYFGRALTGPSSRFPDAGLAYSQDQGSVHDEWTRALRALDLLSVEARLRRFDGEFQWHLIRGQPVHDDAGRLVKWMGTCTNIHAAREANDLSAFLLEVSTESARTDDPHELLCHAMLRLRERLGATQVTLAEIDGLRDEALMLHQRVEETIQVVRLPLQPFRSIALDSRNGAVEVIRDVARESKSELMGLYGPWFGLDRVAALISAPLLGGGSLVASLSVVESAARSWSSGEVELTRRVGELVWPALLKARADRLTALSEERLQLAQAVAQIGTWELDTAAPSIRFSAESFELFGIDPAEAERYSVWLNNIDPRDRHLLGRLVGQCHTSGSGEAEYRYRHPKRGLRWIYSRAGVISDEPEGLIVGISLDVTARCQAEEALREVNRRKDEFLAMLSHELRNPLAPIRNAAQMLRAHAEGQPELEWAHGVIERQSRHLVRLLDDLLDVSRMVRGQIVLQKGCVQVGELTQLAVETSRPLIRSRRHELHITVPTVPITFEGDLTRLAQVVSNLLNNAAKYTAEDGEIWLEVHLEGPQIVLTVRDSGPGIAPELLPHVFELFTQAERPLDRAQGGLGIGLTMVKLIVEMHGGRVEARTPVLGRGAEFVVRLPVRAMPESTSRTRGTATAAEPCSTESAGDSLRILVVDDNVDAADSIAMLLSIDGLQSKSVHSAAAALEAVESFAPDIVLLDIGLPVMDGYEVACRLRAGGRARIPHIVALTGYGQPADRERALRMGFDAFLVKPVEPSALTQLLRSFSPL